MRVTDAARASRASRTIFFHFIIACGERTRFIPRRPPLTTKHRVRPAVREGGLFARGSAAVPWGGVGLKRIRSSASATTGAPPAAPEAHNSCRMLSIIFCNFSFESSTPIWVPPRSQPAVSPESRATGSYGATGAGGIGESRRGGPRSLAGAGAGGVPRDLRHQFCCARGETRRLPASRGPRRPRWRPACPRP